QCWPLTFLQGQYSSSSLPTLGMHGTSRSSWPGVAMPVPTSREASVSSTNLAHILRERIMQRGWDGAARRSSTGSPSPRVHPLPVAARPTASRITDSRHARGSYGALARILRESSSLFPAKLCCTAKSNAYRATTSVLRWYWTGEREERRVGGLSWPIQRSS